MFPITSHPLTTFPCGFFVSARIICHPDCRSSMSSLRILRVELTGRIPRRASFSTISLSASAGGLSFKRSASRPKKVAASIFATCSTGAAWSTFPTGTSGGV